AVVTRAILDRLLSGDARVRRRCDADGECVRTGMQEGGYVEDAALERALHLAHPVPVEPNVRGVVNASEMQREVPACRTRGRCGKLHAVPVVMLVQRFRDREVIQAE